MTQVWPTTLITAVMWATGDGDWLHKPACAESSRGTDWLKWLSADGSLGS